MHSPRVMSGKLPTHLTTLQQFQESAADAASPSSCSWRRPSSTSTFARQPFRFSLCVNFMVHSGPLKHTASGSWQSPGSCRMVLISRMELLATMKVRRPAKYKFLSLNEWPTLPRKCPMKSKGGYLTGFPAGGCCDSLKGWY